MEIFEDNVKSQKNVFFISFHSEIQRWNKRLRKWRILLYLSCLWSILIMFLYMTETLDIPRLLAKVFIFGNVHWKRMSLHTVYKNKLLGTKKRDKNIRLVRSEDIQFGLKLKPSLNFLLSTHLSLLQCLYIYVSIYVWYNFPAPCVKTRTSN